jgi:hypothetical protein
MKTKVNGSGPSVDKWQIKMLFKTSGSMVYYVVLVYDNYYDPSKPLMYKYEGSFWLPHSTANIKQAEAGEGVYTDSLAPGYTSVLNYTTGS